MFAKRLPGEIRPSPLARLNAEKRANGARIFDLTESNPTRAGLVYPVAEILAGFQNPGALIYDPESLGLPAARALIAERYGAAPDRVLLTASTSEAYSWIFKLLCDPGDEVLIPRPSYPLFELLAGLESVTTRAYTLRYHEGWFIDMNSLRNSITARTRAIVVVNPNNPTGSFLRFSEQKEIEDICERNGLALISDEVFTDYALSGSGGSLVTSERVLTFVMNGLSKLAGLPQMKLGWIIVSGPERQRNEAVGRLELIADTYLSVGTPVQYALGSLLAAGDLVRPQIMERNKANLQWLRFAVAGTAASLLDVEAGWSAILRIPGTRTEEQWVRTFLIEKEVLAQPGYFYDFETEAYVVVSLLVEPEVFREGVGRMLGLLG